MAKTTTKKSSSKVVVSKEWLEEERAKIRARAEIKTLETNFRREYEREKYLSSESLFEVARYLVKSECLFLASYTDSESAFDMFMDTANDCYKDKHVSAFENCGNDTARDLIVDTYCILLEQDIRALEDLFGETAKTITFKRLTRSKINVGERPKTKEETATVSKYISRMIRDYFESHHKNLNFDSLEQKSFIDGDGEEYTLYEKKPCESVFSDIYVLGDKTVCRFELDTEMNEYIDSLATRYNLTTNEKLALVYGSLGLSLSAIMETINHETNTKTKNTKAVKTWYYRGLAKISDRIMAFGLDWYQRNR